MIQPVPTPKPSLAPQWTSPLLSLWRIPIVPLDQQCVPPSACPAAHGCPNTCCASCTLLWPRLTLPCFTITRSDTALRAAAGCCCSALDSTLMHCSNREACGCDAVHPPPQLPPDLRARASLHTTKINGSSTYSDSVVPFAQQRCNQARPVSRKGKQASYCPFISLSFPFHFPFPPLLTFL